MKLKSLLPALFFIFIGVTNAVGAEKTDSIYFADTSFTALDVAGKLDVHYVQVKGAKGLKIEILSGDAGNLEVTPEGRATLHLVNIDRPERKAGYVALRVTYGALQSLKASVGADVTAQKMVSARIAVSGSTDAHINIAECITPEAHLASATNAAIIVGNLAAEHVEVVSNTGAQADLKQIECDDAILTSSTGGEIIAAGKCKQAKLTASTNAIINIRRLQCPSITQNFATGATLIR